MHPFDLIGAASLPTGKNNSTEGYLKCVALRTITGEPGGLPILSKNCATDHSPSQAKNLKNDQPIGP